MQYLLCTFAKQKLQQEVAGCQKGISKENEVGSRLVELLGGAACTEVKDTMQQDGENVDSVAEKVKAEVEKVQLQRHRSMEVSSSNSSFSGLYILTLSFCYTGKFPLCVDDLC